MGNGQIISRSQISPQRDWVQVYLLLSAIKCVHPAQRRGLRDISLVCIDSTRNSTRLKYLFRSHTCIYEAGQLMYWFLAWASRPHWRWRRYIPPKLRFTFKGLHDAASQKIPHLWESQILRFFLPFPIVSPLILLHHSATAPSPHVAISLKQIYLLPPDTYDLICIYSPCLIANIPNNISSTTNLIFFS